MKQKRSHIAIIAVPISQKASTYSRLMIVKDEGDITQNEARERRHGKESYIEAPTFR